MKISVKKSLSVAGAVGYKSSDYADDNSDVYELHFDFSDWQTTLVNGEEAEELLITICGNWELAMFFEAVDTLQEMHDAHKGVIKELSPFDVWDLVTVKKETK